VIRVLLVDDQELMRMGFRMVLGAQPDIDVVGEAGDGRRAVELAGELRPDVVLMDVRMPILDGVEATKQIIQITENNATIVRITPGQSGVEAAPGTDATLRGVHRA